jgi:hypothetical protein
MINLLLLPALICFIIALLSKRRPQDLAKATAVRPSVNGAAALAGPARGVAAARPGGQPKVALYTRSAATESAPLAPLAAPEPPEAPLASKAPTQPEPAHVEERIEDGRPVPENGRLYAASGSFATRPDVIGMVHEEMHGSNGRSNGHVADVSLSVPPVEIPKVVSESVRATPILEPIESEDEAPGFLGFSTMTVGDSVVPTASMPEAFIGLLTPQAVAALSPDELLPQLDDDMPAIWPRAIVGNREVEASERLKLLRQLGATKDMVSGLILTEAYAEERIPELREAALRSLVQGLHADARHSFLEAIRSTVPREQQIGVEGLAELEDFTGLETALASCGATAATLAAVALLDLEEVLDPRAYLAEFTNDETVISRALMLRQASEKIA